MARRNQRPAPAMRNIRLQDTLQIGSQALKSQPRACGSRSHAGGHAAVEPGAIRPGVSVFPRIILLGISVNKGSFLESIQYPGLPCRRGNNKAGKNSAWLL